MDNVTRFILIAPILLFSMVAHEYAHGYVAYKNGDPTAYQLGRLTFNPLKHIDPFMTILLPIMLALSHIPILGGAKPVPVNPRYYRNFKRADIMVSLAGIVTNIMIAILCAILVPLPYLIQYFAPTASVGAGIIQVMLVYGVQINLVLAAFNLIPIPPLDGSHVFKYVLPPAWSLSYQRMGRYGLFLIFGLLLFKDGQILQTWLTPAYHVMSWLLGAVERYLLPWATHYFVNA